VCATDPILLAPSSSDAEAKQKRDDISFRTALGEDYDLIQRLHRSVRETELCGTSSHSHAPPHIRHLTHHSALTLTLSLSQASCEFCSCCSESGRPKGTKC
jgi:hypothetical protein